MLEVGIIRPSQSSYFAPVVIVLNEKDLHKPIYEKEMMEILHALKQWHPYLIGRYFKVKIDHDSIKYFLEKILSSKEQ